MKQTIITAVMLICSILSFAQIDSNCNSESNYKVNKFGVLEANVQPNMPAGFDVFGKSLNTKLDSVKMYSKTGSSSISYWLYYFYNPNGSLKYSLSTQAMLNHTLTKTRYFYNYYGLLERSEAKYWNSSNTNPIDSLNIFYEYNQDSLLVKKSEIGVLDNQYDSITTKEYQYDINKNLIKITSYRRLSSSNYLQKNNEEVYYFNNLVLDSTYIYNIDIDFNWLVIFRYYYNYNSNSQVVSDYGYTGNETFPTYMNVYEYFTNSLLKNMVFNYINSYIPANVISPMWKYDYKYDMNTNNTSIAYMSNFYFPSDSSQAPLWRIEYLDSVNFNTNILMSQVVYPYVLQENKNLFIQENSPNAYKQFTVDVNDQLLTKESRDFYYSSFTLGVNPENQEEIEVNISPNPFKESFTLSSEKLEMAKRVNIYNIVGDLVKSELINSNEEVINLPNIASGVYFIRILDKENTVLATKKVIKL